MNLSIGTVSIESSLYVHTKFEISAGIRPNFGPFSLNVRILIGGVQRSIALYRLINKGITVFKIFILGGISSDTRSKII